MQRHGCLSITITCQVVLWYKILLVTRLAIIQTDFQAKWNVFKNTSPFKKQNKINIQIFAVISLNF
jgi:hypothetical protein